MPTIKSVVIASSEDTYPSLLSGGELLEETRPLAPLNPYALSKELSERIGLFRWRSQRLPVSVVRFSVVARAEEALISTGWSGRFLFARGWRDYFKRQGTKRPLRWSPKRRRATARSRSSSEEATASRTFFISRTCATSARA